MCYIRNCKTNISFIKIIQQIQQNFFCINIPKLVVFTKRYQIRRIQIDEVIILILDAIQEVSEIHTRPLQMFLPQHIKIVNKGIVCVSIKIDITNGGVSKLPYSKKITKP